jgi:hypothetical protein
MKLFVWEGEGVLTDYTNGMIVAVANSQEEAEAVISPYTYGRENYPKNPSTVIDLDNFFGAQAFICWGGS